MNSRAVKNIKDQIKKCSKYREMFNYINPIITDVSLRDGIQGLSPKHMTTEKKQIIFQHIYDMKFVNNIEIGSIISHKHMPIMKDVPNLYQSCIHYSENKEPLDEMKMAANQEISNYSPELYVLVPDLKKLKTAKKHGFTNYSFVTSVSDSFQHSNINRSLNDTNIELYKIMEYLKYSSDMVNTNSNMKLYISCIDHCPYEGKINKKDIVTNIVNHACTDYYNEVCLSDTTGKLTFNSYKSIIDDCLQYVDSDVFSLHLHVNKNNHLNVENIIRYSLNKGIRRFDVSLLGYGGCSMTLQPDDKHSNLDYIILCQILHRYIRDNIARMNYNTE